MPETSSVTSAAPTPLYRRRKFVLFVIVAAATLLAIVIAISVMYYSGAFNAGQSANSSSLSATSVTEQSVMTSSITTSSAQTSSLPQGTLYYVQSNNIFGYNLAANDIKQFTNNPSGQNISYGALKVIDADTLGFTQCITVTGDFGCGIYTLKLSTKVASKKLGLAADMFLLDAGFASADEFTYLVETTTTRLLISVTNGQSKTLSEIPVNAYGRGGFDEDAQEIKYSPDGSKVLQIATSSPRSSGDFNVYVYDLQANTEKVIANATHPDWFTNNQIVYRKYGPNNVGDGLYTYNLTTQLSTKLDVQASAARPAVLPGTDKVLYTDQANRHIWLYQLTTGTKQELTGAKEGLTPIWLSDTTFAYSLTRPCTDAEACYADYSSDNLAAFSISSSTFSDLTQLTGIYMYATVYSQ